MLKKLWARLSNNQADVIATRYPLILPESAAQKRAVGVVQAILNANYKAYLVGGCIRDVLLGNAPKDFDVVTSATPEQVCKIFRNARIIGRRFKIVHVRSGPDIIEVTTFRSQHTKSQSNRGNAKQNHKGLLTRDNVYGNIEEDAMRRDFTINSLYFDIETNEVIDFCGGYEAIRNKQLQVIGDPVIRFSEDPVRIIRAVRFSAKLGLTLDDVTKDIIKQKAHLTLEVSSHRMFDEILKLLMHGFALKTYQQLQHFQLTDYLFPPTRKMTGKHYKKLIECGLINTDKRIEQQLAVTPAYLFAFLLWPAYQQNMCKLITSNSKLRFQARFIKVFTNILESQSVAVAIPNHFKQGIEEIWGLQNLLCNTSKRNIEKAYNHRRFRAAYDFLLLREQSGEFLNNSGKFWTDYQKQHPRPVTPRKPRNRRSG